MSNYELEASEVILFEDVVTYSDSKGTIQLTLTSKKIIFEKEKGMLKKERELVDIINLEDIKIYNGNVQVKQKSNEVSVQTIKKNVKITFYSMSKANKFVTQIIDTITGTTTTERNTDKIKGAINTVDDVLGIDTRNTIKEVLENGVVGTLFKGINKKKKDK